MSQDAQVAKHVAILGGTGKEGTGLALRWARAGYTITIGSRRREKATKIAAQLNEKLGADLIAGTGNAEAATKADIVVLTVPYSAHQATLLELRKELQGKLLIDVTVPLQPPHVTRVHLPKGGSAAMEAQKLLGSEVDVVAAFQNVGEHYLRDPERPIDCDVLVCGDDPTAKAQVIELAQALDKSLRAFDAGPLVNAVAVESLTPILINISKGFRRLRVGLRITGVDDGPRD